MYKSNVYEENNGIIFKLEDDEHQSIDISCSFSKALLIFKKLDIVPTKIKALVTEKKVAWLKCLQIVSMWQES